MVVAPGAALRAHDHRRLAGEGGEGRLPVRALGDVAGERRLADAGVAEQAEDLRLARLQPARRPGRSPRPARASTRARTRSRAGAAGAAGARRRGAARGSAAAAPAPPRPPPAPPSARPRRRSASRSAACGRGRRIWRRRPGIGAWCRACRRPFWSWTMPSTRVFGPPAANQRLFRISAQPCTRIAADAPKPARRRRGVERPRRRAYMPPSVGPRFGPTTTNRRRGPGASF